MEENQKAQNVSQEKTKKIGRKEDPNQVHKTFRCERTLWVKVDAQLSQSCQEHGRIVNDSNLVITAFELALEHGSLFQKYLEQIKQNKELPNRYASLLKEKETVIDHLKADLVAKDHEIVQRKETLKSYLYDIDMLKREIAIFKANQPRAPVEPARVPRGAHVGPTRNPHGTHREPTRSPGGTHVEPTRNPRGTHVGSTQNPGGTHMEPTWNPHGTQNGTHPEPTGKIPVAAPLPAPVPAPDSAPIVAPPPVTNTTPVGPPAPRLIISLTTTSGDVRARYQDMETGEVYWTLNGVREGHPEALQIPQISKQPGQPGPAAPAGDHKPKKAPACVFCKEPITKGQEYLKDGRYKGHKVCVQKEYPRKRIPADAIMIGA